MTSCACIQSLMLVCSLQQWVCRLDLEAGHYALLPYTSGCHLKPLRQNHNHTSQARTPLTATGTGGNVLLRPDCKAAFLEIFRRIDLDSNGYISRTEFDFFNELIDGDVCDDATWGVVQGEPAYSHSLPVAPSFASSSDRLPPPYPHFFSSTSFSSSSSNPTPSPDQYPLISPPAYPTSLSYVISLLHLIISSPRPHLSLLYHISSSSSSSSSSSFIHCDHMF